MKITNEKLQLFAQALGEFSKLKVNFKVAHAVSKTLHKVESALKDYDKARENLLVSYCLKKEDGKPLNKDNHYQFENDEVKNKALEEVSKLNDLEIEIDIHSIKLSDLEDMEKTSGNLMYRLGDFITE